MLQIIKASAGSGKTHELTGEYIRLLFKFNDNYRHILAVTFTNKATEEMKSRIIQELNRLASDQPSDYLSSLIKEHAKSETQIREQAKKLLVTILHDYSAFSISTIDRFFQQTVRSFTREVGLHGGYNIELNAEELTEQAIDRLMFDLDDDGKEELIDWLVRFAQAKIEEGKGWNVKRNISVLARELQKEKYKTHAESLHAALSDKANLTAYLSKLMAVRAHYEKRKRDFGEEGMAIMTRVGFAPEDSAHNRFRFFQTLSQGGTPTVGKQILEAIDNVEAWTTKKAAPEIKAAARTAYSDGLNECLKVAVAFMENDTDYNTAGEIIRQFYALGILVDIDKKLRDYAEEKNVMLLSDTTELLNKIIDGSDAPFVYEKIGTRVHHYMIDEFQDTSLMQWQNFHPLINDSLGEGNRNLIVGDVKQSIYRWRGSEWSLLGQHLEEEIEPEKRNIKSLATNWRSNRLVVEFNNRLFKNASFLVQQRYNDRLENVRDYRIADAYSDVEQSLPTEKAVGEGHVVVRFLEKDETSSWQDAALDRMIIEIERLQNNGYALSDIAILVRRKDDGNRVVRHLLKTKNERADQRYDYSFVSDEALFISNSTTVRILIAVLQYFNQPNEPLLRLIVGDEMLTSERFARLDAIGRLSLFEMCEQLIELFGFNRFPAESVFLQAFQDCVLDFVKSKSSDVGSFVDWWRDVGVKRSIAAPKGQNAISIITIHKSKGLQFKSVIIPLCEWSMDHETTHTNILWCEPKVSPFNGLPLLPVVYGSRLERTHFASDYFGEQLQVYVDNLNLGYVAFTRACEELIVFTPAPDHGKKAFSFSEILWDCLMQSYPSFSAEESECCFELGHAKQQSVKQQSEQSTIGTYVAIDPGERLQLRLKSRGFFAEGETLHHGNRMHTVLSRIVTVDDLTNAVLQSVYEGEMQMEESKEVENRLRELLTTPAVQSWFDGSYRVMNEVQILHPSRRFLRPDRVMKSDDGLLIVDYKFGQQEMPRYRKQVESYMDLAREMGYSEVKGYLWYVEMNKIEEVAVLTAP